MRRMKKQLLLLFVVSLMSLGGFAQDMVVDNYGHTYDCYISGEDTSAVRFTYTRDSMKIDTLIHRKDIYNYRYNVTMVKDAPGTKAKSCLSFGLWDGGSTIAGFEYEYKPFEYMGISGGVGVCGAMAAINLHFFPTVRSSYCGLQYNYTGFPDNKTWLGHKYSMFGPFIAFRAHKWFEAKAGMGYYIEKGKAFSGNDNIPVGFIFSIGGYLPL